MKKVMIVTIQVEVDEDVSTKDISKTMSALISMGQDENIEDFANFNLTDIDVDVEPY